MPICGYFRKFSDAGTAAHQGCVKTYCCGPRRGACEREVYRKTHNAMPPDEMMPHGALVA
jgi:hypothetical protein